MVRFSASNLNRSRYSGLSSEVSINEIFFVSVPAVDALGGEALRVEPQRTWSTERRTYPESKACV
jgi:hypothetical protein